MNFRERARDIKAKGESERGNFEPSGVPLRMYKYWARYSPSVPQRENFCHYWRVVMIWAPLFFLMNKAEDFFTSRTGQIISIGLLTLGLVFGVAASGDFRMFLLGLLGAVVLGAVIFGLILLIANLWNDDWNALASKTALGVLVALGGVVMVFVVILGIIDFGWWFPLALVGGVAALCAIVYAAITASEYFAAKRTAKREAFEARIDAMTTDEYREFYQSHNVREPSRIAKFFTGLGDFLVLIGQVVRVNKWKICPMVTIGE